MQGEIATPANEARAMERPATSAQVKSDIPFPKLDSWQDLLWVRDRASDGRNVLVLGKGAALAGILLARLGISVRALDLQAHDYFDAVGRENESAQLVQLEPLDESSQFAALRDGRYDTVAIVRKCLGDLSQALEILASCQTVETVIIVLAFGQQANARAGLIFPRQVIKPMKGFRVESAGIVNGQMRVTMRRATATEAEGLDSSLLLLTEQGADDALQKLRRKVAKLEGECRRARANWNRSKEEARALRDSMSFRLGNLLVLAVRSPRSWLSFPRRFVELFSRRPVARPVTPTMPAEAESAGLSEWQKEVLRGKVAKFMDDGVDAIASEISGFLPDANNSMRAFAQLVAAQECGRRGRHDLEFELAKSALEMNHSIGMVRGFLHVALRSRHMAEASAALRELHQAAARGNRVAKEFIQRFRQTSSYKISVLESIPPRPEILQRVEGGRLLYVLHNSLPYSSGGYATRSHGVASGLASRGRDVICITRPGFPLDVRPEMSPLELPDVESIDGVPYQRVVSPRRVNVPEYKYVKQAMKSMEAEMRKLRPAYVQAASNYVTALPALVAARRIGVPFFYEVRGLWEITRLSRDEAFGQSISFDVQRHIESTVAREADHVFTLTEPMREELIARGVEPFRITLLPNSVDASRFNARERDMELADRLGLPPKVPVIGYIGTFVVYEGLEDLASACVELHRRGIDFRLMMVGNENASGQERGPITEEILRIAREGGIESKVIMPGRVPHEEVESYYSLLDVCPFPRKPWPVCEMVSPMKPLEALAMKKAVIVSSVRALTEMIEHDRTGVVFEKGNVNSLADALADLIERPDKRSRLGEAGREWVVKERCWTQVADRIETVLAEFDSKAVASDGVVVAESSDHAGHAHDGTPDVHRLQPGLGAAD